VARHIYERSDGRAVQVVIRQAKDKQYPRVYKMFNFDKYGGERAARDAARLYEADVMARRARGLTEAAPVKATFREAGSRWHAHGVARGWRASTVADYDSCLRRLNDAFGDLPLAKLTEGRVEEWLATLRKQVAARTIRKLLFVGGAVCQRAHREWPGYTSNPFRAVEGGMRPERRTVDVYSDEEAWAVVRAAATEQEKAILLLAWRAGLRRGEIPPLLVRDVDFVASHLHVRRSYVHGVLNPTPKGRRERAVPLEQEVACALEKLLKDRGDPAGDELLFPGDDGGLLNPDAISASFRAARDAAGVRKLRLHDLRHTYCSRLAMRGVPLWKVAQFAGHSSTMTTEGYAHFAPSDADAETVDEAFAATVKKLNGAADPNPVEALLVKLTELAEALSKNEPR